MSDRGALLAAIGVILGMVLLVIIFAAVVLSIWGCSLDRVPVTPLRDAETRFDDPLAFTGPPIEGRWQDVFGVTLDCGSVMNGWDVLHTWTCWPCGYPYQAPSQRLRALVVYDLTMGPDSIAVGTIKWIGTRDSLKAFTVPLPDSLAGLSWTVWARFSSTDSVLGSVWDSVSGEPVPAYDVRPAWRVKVGVSGAKVYPTESERRLLRVGPHGSTP